MTELEIIVGHKSIAKVLGLTPRQVRRMVDNNLLPTFRIGRNVCARRSTLLQSIIEWERAGKADATRRLFLG